MRGRSGSIGQERWRSDLDDGEPTKEGFMELDEVSADCWRRAVKTSIWSLSTATDGLDSWTRPR